jgi:hypothetical protein
MYKVTTKPPELKIDYPTYSEIHQLEKIISPKYFNN